MDIERYLSIRSAYGAGFMADGTLSFLLDTTGVPQVWTVDEPGGWPVQQTIGENRVTFASPSPTRPELVFGRDEGGNEREQLLALREDGTIENLTQRPDAKHWWGGWGPNGDRFAFTSNRREESVFDVYVRGRASDADAELVYEGDGWFAVAGFAPDGDRLAVTEARSSFDQEVYLLDLEDGSFDHLTPGEAAVRYLSVEWGPDGLYCVTDADGDTLSLARLATDGSGVGTVVDGGDWNVDGVAIDDETGRAVYSRNVEGFTELTVGDLEGSAFAELASPSLPEGVAGGVSFDDGAERFAVTVTAADHNPNLHVVDVGDGEAERWTAASTMGIPPDSFRGAELVRYESFDGRSIPAFVTLPADVPPGGAPVIVDVHGGPESQRRPSFSALKQYFLAQGYAYFEPNVRGSTGYGRAYTHLDDVEKRMDSVADLKAGADWLADHPDVDADRLVAKGGSYGGFMVLAALTEYPEVWAAGVDVVGIANFVTFLENTGSWRRELREAEYGSLADDRAFLESISPVNHADEIRAPLFVIHGANDPRVPVGEAEQIAEAAREHVPVELLVFEDEGHGLTKRENRIEAYGAVAAFLAEHVGPG